MALNIPTKHNAKLRQIVARIDEDVELQQLWECANVNAMSRAGITDHGDVHIRIIANAALKMLRLLVDADVTPSVVADHEMTTDDAEVIVVMAACLHDLGMTVHRDDHERYSLILAVPKIKALLDGIYEVRERTIVMSEILHAIIAHRWDVDCLTVEAGVVKVADALDMTKGRSRIPFEAGAHDIHSVSAAAIEAVSLTKGDVTPIRVDITMSNSAGIFQVDELLKRKLRNSGIAPWVEVAARIETEQEPRLIEFYSITEE